MYSMLGQRVGLSSYLTTLRPPKVLGLRLFLLLAKAIEGQVAPLLAATDDADPVRALLRPRVPLASVYGRAARRVRQPLAPAGHDELCGHDVGRDLHPRLGGRVPRRPTHGVGLRRCARRELDGPHSGGERKVVRRAAWPGSRVSDGTCGDGSADSVVYGAAGFERQRSARYVPLSGPSLRSAVTVSRCGSRPVTAARGAGCPSRTISMSDCSSRPEASRTWPAEAHGCPRAGRLSRSRHERSGAAPSGPRM
jgi:hypothetical protein